MEILPEFFRGPIAQDFQGILAADLEREAASEKTAHKKKKPAKKKQVIKPVHSPLPKCLVSKGCLPTQMPADCVGTAAGCSPPARCPTDGEIRLKASVPDVEGWSFPPDPPAV